MLLRTHTTTGALLALSSAPHGLAAACLVAGIAGAVVPDLDTLPFRSTAGSPFARSPIRHRGLTHSALFLAALLPPVYVIARLTRDPVACTLAFGLGFVAHVLADSLTRSPTYPLWPSRLPLHIPPLFHRRGILTGGLADQALALALSLALAALAVPRFSTLLAEFSVH